MSTEKHLLQNLIAAREFLQDSTNFVIKETVISNSFNCPRFCLLQLQRNWISKPFKIISFFLQHLVLLGYINEILSSWKTNKYY